MKKHIIIAGAPRSGKSTLSNILAKKGYVHYKMDSIKRGIYNNFTYDDGSNWEKISPNMAKLINRIILDNETDFDYKKEYYVIDVSALYPNDVKLIERDCIIVFLGYTDVTIEEKLSLIRKNDDPHIWSNKISDEDLIENWIKVSIDQSKKLKKDCKKLNIMYYDTGKNRKETINEILTKIEEMERKQ